MSRLTFPSSGDRLVFDPGDAHLAPLRSLRGLRVAVYEDKDATTSADIQTLDGDPIENSILTVDVDSLLPRFLGPDNVEELWGRVLSESVTFRLGPEGVTGPPGPSVDTVVGGNTGTAYEVDPSFGSYFDLTLTANCVFSFADDVPNGHSIVVDITQGGGFSVTWPTEVRWSNGVVPSTTPTVGATDSLVFKSRGDGTWDGYPAGLNLV